MNWPEVELGDVAPAKASKRSFSKTDKVWLLNLDQVESETGRVLRKVFSTLSDAGSSTHGFDERHVLYSKLRPYLNKVVLPDGAGIATTELVPMLPDDRRIDRKYLAAYLRSKVFVEWVSSQVAGAKMPRVSMQQFWKHRIPLPSLAEQKRIAAILDAADALRAKRREALAQLDALIQSTFLDMFGDPVTNPKGWPQRALSEVFWLQEGPGVRNWQFKSSGIKLLNVANILKTNELDLEKTDRHLDPGEVELKYSHFLVDEGDLVIASSGISIDDDGLLRTRAAFVRPEHLPLCMNTSTIRFKEVKGVSSLVFLQQWINSYEFRVQITQEVTGSAQKNFGPTHLKRLKITLPPLNLQEQFAERVEMIERQKAMSRSHLVQLGFLFASLQSRAFSGEL